MTRRFSLPDPACQQTETEPAIEQLTHSAGRGQLNFSAMSVQPHADVMDEPLGQAIRSSRVGLDNRSRVMVENLMAAETLRSTWMGSATFL
jgi:hypothetical protein